MTLSGWLFEASLLVLKINSFKTQIKVSKLGKFNVGNKSFHELKPAEVTLRRNWMKMFWEKCRNSKKKVLSPQSYLSLLRHLSIYKRQNISWKIFFGFWRFLSNLIIWELQFSSKYQYCKQEIGSARWLGLTCLFLPDLVHHATRLEKCSPA